MERNYFCDVIILSSRAFGEDNRIFTVLSAERGVFEAVLYGGRKSKLKSMCSPYHSGKMWFYNDEKRHSTKIVDFDVENFRPTIRENLYKTCAAALCSELVIKTRIGETNEDLSTLWVLVKGFLDGLNLVNEKESRLGLLRFLWRFLNLTGFAPDPSFCSICGEKIEASATYSFYTGDFVCENCSNQNENGNIAILPETIKYLQALNDKNPSEVRKIVIFEETVFNLQSFLFYLCEKTVGTKLKSLEAGKNIL